MKKVVILSAIAAGSLFFNKANAQISIHLGFNIPVHRVYVPAPRPVVVDETPVYNDDDNNTNASYDNDYYYLPEVEAYYNVSAGCYYYNDGNSWVSAAYLPGAYRNYDWRTATRYEVRAPRPYLHHDLYRSRWGGYAGDRNNWGHRFDNRPAGGYAYNRGGYDNNRGGWNNNRNNDRGNWGGQPNRGGNHDNHGNWGGQPSNGGSHDNHGNWGGGQPNNGGNHGNQGNWGGQPNNGGGHDNHGNQGGQPNNGNQGNWGGGQPNNGGNHGNQGGGQPANGGGHDNHGSQGGGQPANHNDGGHDRGNNGGGGEHFAQNRNDGHGIRVGGGDRRRF